jgi:hypothetical protein
MNTCTLNACFFPPELKNFLLSLKNGKKRNSIPVYYIPEENISEGNISEIYFIKDYFLNDKESFKKRTPHNLFIGRGLMDIKLKNDHLVVYDKVSRRFRLIGRMAEWQEGGTLSETSIKTFKKEVLITDLDERIRYVSGLLPMVIPGEVNTDKIITLGEVSGDFLLNKRNHVLTAIITWQLPLCFDKVSIFYKGDSDLFILSEIGCIKGLCRGRMGVSPLFKEYPVLDVTLRRQLTLGNKL